MDNVAIPCLMINAPIQNIKEEQKNSDASTTLDNQDNYNLENENDPFNVELSFPEKKFNPKIDEIKNGTGEKNQYKNPSFLYKNSGFETRKNSTQEIKKALSEVYLLKKNFEEKVKNRNSSLEPKYEKGFQVILRRLNYNEMASRFLLENNIGHIFLRYYDEKNGIDIIIESVKKDHEKGAINQI